jgi:hypothetical protein
LYEVINIPGFLLKLATSTERYGMYIKVVPLQALTGPEGSRRLKLPDFKTIDI